jgi:Na+(H+)/acetate symporter ActP
VVRKLIAADGIVLAAAAAVELALAVGAAHVGSGPGDDAPGAEVAVPAGSLAMLVGIALAVLGARRAVRWTAILSPAAGLFLTTFFYTEDPYFAPTRRRYSDGGAVAATGIYVVLAVCVVAGLVAWRKPRVGGFLVAFALGSCWLTTLAAGDGH